MIPISGGLYTHPSISVWMDVAEHWTTFLLNGSGEVSNIEDIYLKGYATPAELHCGLKEYFILFNVNRPHQSLGYSTPDKVYRTASGGGAGIVDKYKKLNKLTEELKVQEGKRLSAA